MSCLEQHRVQRLITLFAHEAGTLNLARLKKRKIGNPLQKYRFELLFICTLARHPQVSLCLPLETGLVAVLRHCHVAAVNEVLEHVALPKVCPTDCGVRQSVIERMSKHQTTGQIDTRIITARQHRHKLHTDITARHHRQTGRQKLYRSQSFDRAEFRIKARALSGVRGKFPSDAAVCTRAMICTGVIQKSQTFAG